MARPNGLAGGCSPCRRAAPRTAAPAEASTLFAPVPQEPGGSQSAAVATRRGVRRRPDRDAFRPSNPPPTRLFGHPAMAGLSAPARLATAAWRPAWMAPASTPRRCQPAPTTGQRQPFAAIRSRLRRPADRLFDPRLVPGRSAVNRAAARRSRTETATSEYAGGRSPRRSAWWTRPCSGPAREPTASSRRTSPGGRHRVAQWGPRTDDRLRSKAIRDAARAATTPIQKGASPHRTPAARSRRSPPPNLSATRPPAGDGNTRRCDLALRGTTGVWGSARARTPATRATPSEFLHPHPEPGQIAGSGLALGRMPGGDRRRSARLRLGRAREYTRDRCRSLAGISFDVLTRMRSR